MIEVSKKTRKELRQLLLKAYTNELNEHLLKLSLQFDNWKSKKIDCWQLEEYIHKFDNGTSKKLFKTYNVPGIHDLLLVAKALSRGLLKKEDVPKDILDTVEGLATEFYDYRQ